MSYKIVLWTEQIIKQTTRSSDQIVTYFTNYFLKIKVRFISNRKTNRKYEDKNVVDFHGNRCRSGLLCHDISRYSSLCANGKRSVCIIFEIGTLDLFKTNARTNP